MAAAIAGLAGVAGTLGARVVAASIGCAGAPAQPFTRAVAIRILAHRHRAHARRAVAAPAGATTSLLAANPVHAEAQLAVAAQTAGLPGRAMLAAAAALTQIAARALAARGARAGTAPAGAIVGCAAERAPLDAGAVAVAAGGAVQNRWHAGAPAGRGRARLRGVRIGAQARCAADCFAGPAARAHPAQILARRH